MAAVGPHLQPDPLTDGVRAPHDARARAEARAGLYVHVPFCARRCTYCDFSTGPLSEAGVRRYLTAIEREAERRAPAAADLEFTSVFFGGGTPSALTAAQFRTLWRSVSSRFRIAPDAERTLEANPESVRPDRLEAWVEAGVNRISMGAQSADPDELRVLGRIHDAARPARAFAEARASGVRRLSLDLMFGFPGHRAATWARTLDAALALEPEHLSAYCFIPERGTPLGDHVLRHPRAVPDGDAQADLYATVTARTEAAGLTCYETSNFCLPGAEARHNLVYWLRRPYVGLGPSAHGHLAGTRYGNLYAREAWAAAIERGEAPEAHVEQETPASAALETVMLGLRLASGLRAADHPRAAWAGIVARYGAALEAAVGAGRLERTADGWRVAARHRFVADDVIAWIEARTAGPEVDTPPAAFIPSLPCPTPHSPAT